MEKTKAKEAPQIDIVKKTRLGSYVRRLVNLKPRLEKLQSQMTVLKYEISGKTLPFRDDLAYKEGTVHESLVLAVHETDETRATVMVTYSDKFSALSEQVKEQFIDILKKCKKDPADFIEEIQKCAVKDLTEDDIAFMKEKLGAEFIEKHVTFSKCILLKQGFNLRQYDLPKRALLKIRKIIKQNRPSVT